MIRVCLGYKIKADHAKVWPIFLSREFVGKFRGNGSKETVGFFSWIKSLSWNQIRQEHCHLSRENLFCAHTHTPCWPWANHCLVAMATQLVPILLCHCVCVCVCVCFQYVLHTETFHSCGQQSLAKKKKKLLLTQRLGLLTSLIPPVMWLHPEKTNTYRLVRKHMNTWVQMQGTCT